MGPRRAGVDGWGRHTTRRLGRLAVLLCLGAAMLSSAHAKNWLRAESDHFVIYSDIGESKTRAYVEQLEAFKYLVELMLGADPNSSASSATFTIYLLSDREALRVIRPETHKQVAGFYLHCTEGSVAFASRQINWDAWQPDDGLVILLHEYTHHLMFSRMQRFYPRWYVEGFADYMSTTTLHKGTYRVGGLHHHRIPFLGEGTRWLDSRVLLDPIEFREAVKEGEVNSLQFYAQAWLLTHYMLSDSRRTSGFNAYFDRMGQGENAIESFESETGIGVDALAREMRSHLRRLPGIRVTVPNLPDAAIKTTRLPSSLDDYVLEAATLQTCPDEEFGTALTEKLHGLRARHAKDPQFRLELARAELLFGDAQAARSELEALAQTGHQDPELFYLLGRSAYAAAEEDPEQSEALRNQAAKHFLSAYKLRRLHPPTLYFLSMALDNDAAPSKSVVNAATGAAVLAPSVFSYAFNAALVNLRVGDRETAISVMQPYASNPHDTSHAARVIAMIEAIREDKSIEEIIEAIAGWGSE